MQKSTKTMLIIIGLLSILAGVYHFFNNGFGFESGVSVFLGVSIIGAVFSDKAKQQ